MAQRNDDTHTAMNGLTQAVDRLRSTPIADIRRFDASMRDRSWSEPSWFPGMFGIEPTAVHELIDATPDQAGAALVLACHTNGRVREQALKSRAFTLDHYSLPILILRSADWVPQVRSAAETAFANAWGRSSEHSKLAVLPLMWHLSREGSRLSSQVRAALDVYLLGIDPEVSSQFSHPDPRVRRIMAASSADRLPTDRLHSLALAETDPSTARALARILFERTLNVDALELLATARVGSVRADALAKLATTDPAGAEGALRHALLDTNAIARSFAQHQLNGRGIDPRSVYVELVSHGNLRALPGLCETATTADRARADALLTSPLAAEQLWGLRMLSTIGHDQGPRPDRLVELVRFGPSKVRRLAARLLQGCAEEDVLAELWSITKDPVDPGRRRIILRHFLTVDRFVALKFALGSLARSENEPAAELVDGVMSSWNRSFTSPRAADLEVIESALPDAVVKLDSARADMVVISLKPFMADGGLDLARLRADRLREIREGLYGLEFDFLVRDYAGHLAVFSAGYGPVPLDALTRTAAEDSAVEAIDRRETTGSAIDHAMTNGDLTFWRRKAERDFYTYDWNEHDGPYLKQCTPNMPVTTGDIDLPFRPLQMPGYFASVDRVDLRDIGIRCEPDSKRAESAPQTKGLLRRGLAAITARGAGRSQGSRRQRSGP